MYKTAHAFTSRASLLYILSLPAWSACRFPSPFLASLPAMFYSRFTQDVVYTASSLWYAISIPPIPSPTRDQLVQSRRVNYAKQLFLMDHRGENVRQITERGGENLQWTPDGNSFLFKRDVHRGEGARYVPYRFDLTTREAEPLWPALPDSVPEFPPLSTQEPLFNPDL